MKGATRRLTLAMGAMTAVVLGVVGVTMVLGGSTNRPLGDDLLLTTRTIEIETALVVVDGKDAPADVGPGGQANLDVLRIPLGGAMEYDVFDNSPALDDPLPVVRDPLQFGSLQQFLEADRLVILLQPRLDPTRDRLIEYSVRLIALDADRNLVAADWEGDGRDQLAALLEWSRGRGLSVGDTMARATRAVVAPTGAPEEAEILAIIGD